MDTDPDWQAQIDAVERKEGPCWRLYIRHANVIANEAP
jgi:hypothetical protein